MDISFLINVSLLGLFGMAAVLVSRSALIPLMLLPASHMLGLTDAMAFRVKGVVDINLLVAGIVLLVTCFSIGRLSEFQNAKFVRPILVIVLLWLYGVLYPVANDYSSFSLALKASKEFLPIFSYFAVFLFLRTQREITWGWRFLIAFGLYYSAVEIVAQFLGKPFLGLLSYDYDPQGRLWKLYLPFWPLILLAFLTTFFKLALGLHRPFASLVTLTVGLFLTFFRSYTLATLVTIPAILAVGRPGLTTVFSRTTILITVFMVTIIVIGLVIGGSLESTEGMFDLFIGSGIAELRSQTGGSLEGREVFAKERRAILARSPYMGYGFIDQDSKAAAKFKEEMTGDHLGFIDKGDVDVAVKFGGVGRVVLFGTCLYLCLKLIRLARERVSPLWSAHCLALASVVAVFLLVQPVHAPLTYSFGLLPLGIALGLLDREGLLLQRDDS